MKKYLLGILLALLVLGCAPKPNVKFVENSISSDISVEGVRERTKGQLKEIEVYGENESGDYMKFRYRVVWKDKDGFEVKSMSSNWQDFSVFKETPYQFSIIAPSIDAVDYMVYIDEPIN